MLALYKFLRKDGSQKVLTAREGESGSLLGKPYNGNEYTWSVNEPIYLAYTLLRVDENRPVTQWESVKADEVKAGTRQDIFSATGGVFRLPATRWRLSLFVNAVDVYDPASALNRELAIPGTSLLKEERFEVSLRKSASQTEFVPVIPKNQRELIRKNRTDLVKKIGQFPVVPRLSQVRVGVAEAKGSVQVEHPDFVGVWHQKSGATELIPVPTAGSAEVADDDIIKTFVKANDHGGHVAGLIAARGDTAPGLAQGVQLFLIDTTNQESEASLEKDINDAISRDVKIFNLSFTIGGDDAPQVDVSLDNLKTRMRTSLAWRDALFIAAAGNEGRDLSDIGDRVPVKWVGDVPNIIGVAAADESNNILGDWICAPERQPPLNTCKGSNYGHRYVHLVAPGLNVYSTASDGKYALSTGSSQAVPLVTAAAAMLHAQLTQPHPSVIKGRLIYTADWLSQFDNSASEQRKVWGGMLNFRRAVMHPGLNLLSIKNFPDELNAFKYTAIDKIKIKNVDGECMIDDPDDDPVPCPAQIAFDNILRITLQPNNKLFRVIYLDAAAGKTLRIMRDVILEGEIRCDEMLGMDLTTNQFDPLNKCNGNVPMNSILDYVSAVPGGPIRF